MAKSMKGYVINLDRSTERLSTFRRRSEEAGLLFERFPGVDGASLDEDLLADWTRLARRWAPVTVAEVGTFLSHRGVWQRVAEGSDAWALVVEDDVVFSLDCADILASSDWLPDAIHLIKVETMRTRIELSARVFGQKGNYKVRRLKENHNGTAGYIISREGARVLLNWTESRCEPVDRLMFHPSQLASTGFPIGQMVPALCMQDFHLLPEQEQAVAQSTIGPVRNRRMGKARDKRAHARVWRFAVRSLRDIIRLGLWACGISVFERVGMPSYTRR